MMKVDVMTRRKAFTLVELLIVLAIILILAALAAAAIAGASGDAQRSITRSNLEVIDTKINTFSLSGDPSGKFPVDPALAPDEVTANAPANNLALNKSVVERLAKGHVTGKDPLPGEFLKIDPADNKPYLVDPYGREMIVKVRLADVSGRPGIRRITAVYVYSTGPDAIDDFPAMKIWLAGPGTWPAGEAYNDYLATVDPTNPGRDNVYP